MTIRTHHRRISPRTKRRYRAIKNFFRKALGTPSQTAFKDTSSIAVSVSGLKSKIIGIEEQLHKVSKHCRDFSCLEHNLRKKSLNQSISQSLRDESVSHPIKSYRNLNEVEAKIIYKRSDESRELKLLSQDDKNNMSLNNHGQGPNFNYTKDESKNKQNFLEHRRRARSRSKPPGSVYSSGSFHSLIDSKNRHCHGVSCLNRRNEVNPYIEPLAVKECTRYKHKISPQIQFKTHGSQERPHKSKREKQHLDHDFITEIINKQYKPVKLFGRRDSDFSQFSAPLCRDQEFKICKDMQEDCELCSCCLERHKRRKRYLRDGDFGDTKSICDTRLYSSKKNRRYKYMRGCVDDYNNSAYYDVVPVKEKTSPKSRRKFFQDHITRYPYCKEVPPSPRSHKPRLNLKAQYHSGNIEIDDYEKHRSRKNSPIPNRRRDTRYDETDVSSEYSKHKRSKENIKTHNLHKPTQIQEDIGTMSSVQYTNFVNEHNNSINDTTLNTQGTNFSADKTDKALSEIKDILQSFLQEIKKETAHVEKSDVSSKIDDKISNGNQDGNKMNAAIPNSGHSFNNYSMGQCGIPPFVPAYTNPCCYHMMPLCPMNCLQNGYIMPNPSYTCNVCSKNSKPACSEKDCCDNKIRAEEVSTSTETHELIKEIYKFVSQNTKSPRHVEHYTDKANSKYDNHRSEKRKLTSRSVGGSTKAFHNDANVGTPDLRCYSKSCEAIGCRINSESFNTTTASYSDTILEKLSLRTTQSSTDSDESDDVPVRKNKQNKFKKVLQSLKLFKKKHKKDVIVEESESESTVEVDVKPKSPFRQNIANYAMHGQEFFHPPPIPQQHCCSTHHHELSYGQGFDSRGRYMQPPDIYNHQRHHHTIPQCCAQNPTPPCPNYDPRYNHSPQPVQPQVPLCLKEIEVKSIGTQSVRKMSLLEKLTAKTQPPQVTPQRPISTAPLNEKPNFWKTLQEKAKQNNPDPMDFSLKTQNRLAQGDMKMRNAMLKKLFYKRNPFSPRNLIIKTILGKDKSSFGDPPKMYRPRMFL